MNRICSPDVIIAGAPKCGTTSMFEWLSDHPEICGSKVKETYYLMDRESPLFDTTYNYYEYGLKGYSKFYPYCMNQAKLRLEATPDYLYQKTPLRALAQNDKDIKIIFLLRKPSNRAYSAYKFFSGHKAIFNRPLSFADYLDHVRNNSGPVDHYLWPLVRNTIQYGEYVHYIKKWVHVFGQASILLYLFEDLCRDPKGMMVDVAEKLNIESGFYNDYDYAVHNSSYSVKSVFLHRLKNKMAALVPNSYAKRLLGKMYKSINIGSFKADHAARDLSAFESLDSHYELFNRQLAAQFRMSLDNWK